MSWLRIAYLIALGGAFALLVQGMWLGMLRGSGLLVPNFQGKEIPVGMGPLFLGSAAFAFWLGELIGFLSLSAFLSFLFRGHFRNLLRGKLTTGGLKAMGGGFLALLVATTLTGEPARIFLAALLIALSANTLNLFDLRPGRALKLFWLGVLILVSIPSSKLFVLMPIVGVSLVYAPLDLRAKAMLGDSGSNCLGCALGYSLAASLSWQWQLAVVVFLFLLNLLSERYSFSAIIEKNPLLRFLDLLGRGQ